MYNSHGILAMVEGMGVLGRSLVQYSGRWHGSTGGFVVSTTLPCFKTAYVARAYGIYPCFVSFAWLSLTDGLLAG